mmetsp:Transcript_33699/g.64202  ORF Transcript_33699/g.64202 Transcript_33699/m.64202 type:complete len:207 (+) Transcript_33699:2318-2938(+)
MEIKLTIVCVMTGKETTSWPGFQYGSNVANIIVSRKKGKKKDLLNLHRSVHPMNRNVRKKTASCINNVGKTKSNDNATRAFTLETMLAIIGYRIESSTPTSSPPLLLPPVVELPPLPAPCLFSILSANFPPRGVPMIPANAATMPNQYAASRSSSKSWSARTNAPPKVPREATTPIIAAQPKDRVTRTGELIHAFISEKSVNFCFG